MTFETVENCCTFDLLMYKMWNCHLLKWMCFILECMYFV